ncbi:MAG: chorismate-binding protein [Bacteroidia bacterium]|nr:chorismate-binding protein [Bacteroidia bacterium]
MSQTLIDRLHNRIDLRSRLFCWCPPGSTKVTCYVLDHAQTSFPSGSNETYLTLCGFDSNTPRFYRCIESLVLEREVFLEFQFPTPTLASLPPITGTSKVEYTNGVETAKNRFKTGDLSKVVLAQRQGIATSSLNIFACLQTLCKSPDRYHYLFHLPEEETWIGSSPELFFKSNNDAFETMALAGTRLAGDKNDWGDKELKEQAIVSQFINSQLIALGFSNVTVHPRLNKASGSIEHICSPITAQIPENLNWLEVFKRLHPTPALAGYPQKAAIQFIKENEGFDRELFGGFMGIVSPKEMELFVNIRCAKLGQERCYVYAGAGLNDSSSPLEEWHETNNKLEVMLNLLN